MAYHAGALRKLIAVRSVLPEFVLEFAKDRSVSFSGPKGGGSKERKSSRARATLEY